MAFFCAMVLVQLIRYFRTATELNVIAGKQLWPGERKTEPLGRRFWLELAAAFVLSRAFVLAVCSLFAACTGGLEGFWENFWGWYWCRWDGDHYIGLIRNWYVTEGDARLHLVFFPLYPLIGRGLHLLGMSAEAAAMVVSNVSLFGCGAALGALTAMTWGVKNARRAVWLLMFCPLTFFFSMPYTESLFLLVTLLSVLMARKKRYGWAVFFGALAANARMVGMTAAIPIFWEMLHDAWQAYAAKKGDGARRRDAEFLRRACVCALRVLPVLLGFAAYLWLNYSLHGNPFQFLIYQKSNWSQEMGSLAGTIQYTLTNAISYHSWEYQYGVWIPQIVTIFAAIVLMAMQWRRQHPGDAAYALVYFYLSVSPTWLLSGTRYTAAMYALYPLLIGLLPGRKFWFGMAVELILLSYMAIMGVNIGYVL